MNFKPVFENVTRPIQVLGPCSAETEEQVMATARQLAENDFAKLRIVKPAWQNNWDVEEISSILQPDKRQFQLSGLPSDSQGIKKIDAIVITTDKFSNYNVRQNPAYKSLWQHPITTPSGLRSF